MTKPLSFATLRGQVDNLTEASRMLPKNFIVNPGFTNWDRGSTHPLGEFASVKQAIQLISSHAYLFLGVDVEVITSTLLKLVSEVLLSSTVVLKKETELMTLVADSQGMERVKEFLIDNAGTYSAIIRQPEQVSWLVECAILCLDLRELTSDEYLRLSQMCMGKL